MRPLLVISAVCSLDGRLFRLRFAEEGEEKKRAKKKGRLSVKGYPERSPNRGPLGVCVFVIHKWR